MASLPRVSFVVPALNEELNIAATVQSILSVAPQCCSDYELVLVNDGSTDGTGAVMDRLAAGNPHIRVVHNPRNLGYGGAFKAGAAAATMDYVVRVCADNVTPTTQIARVLAEVGRADIVLPYLTNAREFRSVGRRLGSWAFTFVINTLFGHRIRYYNHCVVFRRQDLQAIQINTNGFAYQAEAVVKLLRAGRTYCEVGVADVDRVHGRSSALKPKNLWRVLVAIRQLYRDVHS
jgi:glycosyltransferase involved in cell wall biosynthesis